jgi:Zn-dependent peptidase ImmA (M78 family)
MNDDLRIEFDWLDRETGSDLDRALAASIGVAVGGEYLTRLDDLGAKTRRNQVLASAWHLANWFAANWWRLRWEPAPAKWREDPDWRMAHSLAAAGGGYVWPNAIFASDGDSMEIAAKPKSKGARFEPVRYINEVQAWITAAEFERKVDGFMEGVLSRMQSLKLQDECLPRLWDEIQKERSNAQFSEQRKLEAMAGFDPDQAPAGLIENLLEDLDNLGKSALAELAAEARHKTGEALQMIRELGRSRSKPRPGGFRVRLPPLPRPPVADDDALPWQKAANLARLARTNWGLGKKPIGNRALSELLSAKATIFSDNSIVATLMPLGIRTGANATFDIYFNRPSDTTRRFAASRLLGDFLHFSNQERLLPATHAKTSRQKFQRSFAQEFLCPIDALLEKIQTNQPDEDDIQEAADHFHVSPRMVKTTLVNHGQLEREALTWAD